LLSALVVVVKQLVMLQVRQEVVTDQIQEYILLHHFLLSGQRVGVVEAVKEIIMEIQVVLVVVV
jgi:hypothetical protein